MIVTLRNSIRWISIALLAAGLAGACGSRTDPEEAPPLLAANPTRSTPSSNPAHSPLTTLPPAIAARLEPLQARLAENPHDLGTRKQIAVILLTEGQLLPAFEQAEEILRADPDDIDGLYVHGVVRIAMGQGSRAIEMFDRVLFQNPNHIPALTARGRAEMKVGNVDKAIASWERALAVAGGNHGGLEALLRQARAQRTPTASPADSGSSAAANPENGEAQLFHVRVELAPGTRFDPEATLVASLRGLTGGPPAAVKTVTAPSFPLELTFGPDDSAGPPLPVLGILEVQLDNDGNSTTPDSQAISAEATAVSGGSTKIVLAAG